MKTLKVPPQKFDFFTDDELERLIDAAKVEPEWRTAIVLAVFCWDDGRAWTFVTMLTTNRVGSEISL